MGAVHFSIDSSLAEILKRVLPLEVFVETGTFKGDSVQQVRCLFREIYTVESSGHYYELASERFKSDPGIHVYHDTSAEFLRRMMPGLVGRSVLYWLDAHSCGEEKPAKGVPQCPLLEELAAIGGLNDHSVLLIDDARLFLSPPPPPYDPEEWPSLDHVMKGLHSVSTGHELLVLNDVFIYFPSSAEEILRNFASQHNVDWLTIFDKARDYNDVLAKFQLLEREAQEQIEFLAGEARAKDREIESLALETRAKDREIESLAVEARGKDREIESLALQAREKDAEIQEKELQIQRQHVDILKLLQEVSDSRRSSS